MDRVTLWHGTTLDRAQCIQDDGFRPLDLLSELQTIADRYDVTTDALQKTLADHGRFAAIQHVRADLVWLATSSDAAERWASRAPEIRWEALWAVWWITNDPDDLTPWRSPAAAAWHVRQLFGSQPVVMEIEVPVQHVLESTGNALSPAEVQTRIRINSPELSIRPPGEISWIKQVQPTRRPIDFTAVAGLLGISVDDLEDEVRAGGIPEPQPPVMPLGDWIWFEDELADFVPQEFLERTV
ncbi:hypothetical protein [Nocardia wallacei]|uniref:hypothetical protein n=1 Tax=Nocardia wallacei TaxID=480035 RepID=UPI0024588A8A|nr:hypothetical protein [Nocardia wallacei]